MYCSPHPAALHIDPPPGSGDMAFRIRRVENCLRQELAGDDLGWGDNRVAGPQGVHQAGGEDAAGRMPQFNIGDRLEFEACRYNIQDHGSLLLPLAGFAGSGCGRCLKWPGNSVFFPASRCLWRIHSRVRS